MPPKIDIDEDLVEDLASIHCTQEEIGAIVGCSVDTLKRRFADAIERGTLQGKESLRRLQWKKAQAGNIVMLIWLGKQWLGQTDKAEMTVGEVRAIFHPIPGPGANGQAEAIDVDGGEVGAGDNGQAALPEGEGEPDDVDPKDDTDQ